MHVNARPVVRKHADVRDGIGFWVTAAHVEDATDVDGDVATDVVWGRKKTIDKAGVAVAPGKPTTGAPRPGLLNCVARQQEHPTNAHSDAWPPQSHN